MKSLLAISLHQPWPALIELGIKKHETRSWMLPRKHWGRTMAMHAAKRKISAFPVPGPLASALNVARPGWHTTLPRGAFVLTFRVTACYLADLERARTADPQDVMAGDWEPGRWLWRIEDVRPLARPCPATGRQSLWTCDATEFEF